MPASLARLLLAQFLSALADNAILFTALAWVLQHAAGATWMVAAMQASFLLAFVFCAPWVGRWADHWPKPRILLLANAIKAAGALLMLLGLHPLLAYALVGLGAALYSPAKYGILPELLPADQLVRANGWIEGSTIAAIVTGSVLGGWLADHSINLALTVEIALFAVSASVAFSIRLPAIHPQPWPQSALAGFLQQARCLLQEPLAWFTLLSCTLFWTTAALLRIMLVAWAPVVLGLGKSQDIAMLTVFIAAGVVLGSLLAHRWIGMQQLRRVRYAGYVLGALIVTLSGLDALNSSRIVLLLIGMAGGLFVVPLNATLQHIGHQRIGSGCTIAVQHFYENLGMLLGLMLTMLATALGASPIISLAVLGGLVIFSTVWVSSLLPATPLTFDP